MIQNYSPLYNISNDKTQAKLLTVANILLWVEATKLENVCIKILDRTRQDFRNNNIIDGITFFKPGDIWQTPPILLRETKADELREFASSDHENRCFHNIVKNTDASWLCEGIGIFLTAIKATWCVSIYLFQGYSSSQMRPFSIQESAVSCQTELCNAYQQSIRSVSKGDVT